METTENSPSRAYKFSRLLHWVCAIFFVLLVISMPIMLAEANNSAERAEVYMIHQSIATIFFLLLTVRFIWFFISRENGTSIVFEYRWQEIIAKINHFILYGIMIFMPLSGIITRIAAGKAIVIFNVQLLPVIDSLMNKDVKFYTNETHLLLVNAFYLLIFLHIVGAVSHVIQKRNKDKK